MSERPRRLAGRRRTTPDERVELEQLRAEVRAVASAVEGLAREQGNASRLLMARLEDVQGLVARAYETPLGWRQRLAKVRSDAGYELPWTQPEPLVSVRIATYNNSRQLCERTLASLLAQTYEHWEAVVVGDAVTDDTGERIEALGDPRIRFLNLGFRGPYPEDEQRRRLVAGTAPANLGIRESRGVWIAPLDHDDEFEPDHIERLLEHARATRAELVYGKLRVRHAETGEVLPNVVGAWPPVYSQFGFQGAMYHRGLSAFEYDDGAYLAGEPGDWNLARRMWQAGVRFAFLDRIVTTYYWVPRDEQGRAWLASVRAADGGVSD